MTDPSPMARPVRVATSSLPTRHGAFTIHVYDVDGEQIVALVKGDTATTDSILVRLHSECMTGDVFGSLRCDCGPQFNKAMRLIDGEGVGAIVYLDQEGRGIGLLNKIRAYKLQEDGLDTVDANLALGFDADLRDYGAAAAVLRHLGITRVRLLTNNPRKVAALDAAGVAVADRLPLIIETNPHNAYYLATKTSRLGHQLPATARSRPLTIENAATQPGGAPDLGSL